MRKDENFGHLRVRHDVIVVVAEAARAADELAEQYIAKRIPAPAVGVSALHLLRLLPALLLHAVREASGVALVVVRRIIENPQLHVVRCEYGGVEERGGGCSRSGAAR